MNKVVEKGELAYIPSHVKIVRYGENDLVRAFHVTKEPVNLLVVEEANHKGRIAVHYRGGVWYVDQNSVYSQKEG